MLPVQPVPNPSHNRLPQPVKNIDIHPFRTYMIAAIPVNEIQLRSGKIVNKGKSVVVIQEEVTSTSSENHFQNDKQQP